MTNDPTKIVILVGDEYNGIVIAESGTTEYRLSQHAVSREVFLAAAAFVSSRSLEIVAQSFDDEHPNSTPPLLRIAEALDCSIEDTLAHALVRK